MSKQILFIALTSFLVVSGYINIYAGTKLYMNIRMENYGNKILPVDSFAIKNLQTGDVVRKAGNVYEFDNTTEVEESPQTNSDFEINFDRTSLQMTVKYLRNELSKISIKIYNINGACIYDNRVALRHYSSVFDSETKVDFGNFGLGLFFIVIADNHTIARKMILIDGNSFAEHYDTSLIKNIVNYEIIAYKHGVMPDTLIYGLNPELLTDTITFTGRVNPRWLDYEVVIKIDSILVERYNYSYSRNMDDISKYESTDTVFYNYQNTFSKNCCPDEYSDTVLISCQSKGCFGDTESYGEWESICNIELDEEKKNFTKVFIQDYYEETWFPSSGTYTRTTTKKFNFTAINLKYKKYGDDYIATIKGVNLVSRIVKVYQDDYDHGSTDGGMYSNSSETEYRKVVKILPSSKITITVRKKK
jgi:hypothetical protein